MDEETKKDEEKLATTDQESSASGLPDSKLDGVAGGEFTITSKIDKSSPKLFTNI
jgi:type VI protein secretion system component Hcp